MMIESVLDNSFIVEGGFFYDTGNFVPYIIKPSVQDAHSREGEVCRTREFA